MATQLKIGPKDIIIMQLVAKGLRLSQIAEKMGLSERTIESRISRLKNRLDCKTITHVAITLLRAKVIK